MAALFAPLEVVPGFCCFGESLSCVGQDNSGGGPTSLEVARPLRPLPLVCCSSHIDCHPPSSLLSQQQNENETTYTKQNISQNGPPHTPRFTAHRRPSPPHERGYGLPGRRPSWSGFAVPHSHYTAFLLYSDACIWLRLRLWSGSRRRRSRRSPQPDSVNVGRAPPISHATGALRAAEHITPQPQDESVQVPLSEGVTVRAVL